jgi:hypothetical protein
MPEQAPAQAQGLDGLCLSLLHNCIATIADLPIASGYVPFRVEINWKDGLPHHSIILNPSSKYASAVVTIEGSPSEIYVHGVGKTPTLTQPYHAGQESINVLECEATRCVLARQVQSFGGFAISDSGPWVLYRSMLAEKLKA